MKLHEKLQKKNLQRMMSFPSNSQLTEGELAQMRVNQLCAKLRSMTLPPSWMDQSEE